MAQKFFREGTRGLCGHGSKRLVALVQHGVARVQTSFAQAQVTFGRLFVPWPRRPLYPRKTTFSSLYWFDLCPNRTGSELMVIWKGGFETVPCRATLNTPFSALCPRILGTRFTNYGLRVSGSLWFATHATANVKIGSLFFFEATPPLCVNFCAWSVKRSRPSLATSAWFWTHFGWFSAKVSRC